MWACRCHQPSSTLTEPVTGWVYRSCAEGVQGAVQGRSTPRPVGGDDAGAVVVQAGHTALHEAAPTARGGLPKDTSDEGQTYLSASGACRHAMHEESFSVWHAQGDALEQGVEVLGCWFKNTTR